MALHVIVGKGPVGSTTAEELVSRGHEVRVLSRSGGQSTEAIEHRQVDATDAAALTEGARGAAALYNA
ncbi:MAG: epimerase, partial [Blastococcus sp.]